MLSFFFLQQAELSTTDQPAFVLILFLRISIQHLFQEIPSLKSQVKDFETLIFVFSLVIKGCESLDLFEKIAVYSIVKLPFII